MLELSCIARGPVGVEGSCLDLLEELEAPRLVGPWPLDRFEERFGVDPRAPRELLPRSSIVLVVDHEEEAGGREEEILEREMRRNGDWESSYCTALCLLLCKLATSWTMPGFRAMPILAEFLPRRLYMRPDDV